MKQTLMKAMGIACLTVLMAVSCTKVENVFDETSWQGEYPVQLENGTTGEMEDHVATIALSFQHNGTDCTVETGVVGLYAANRVWYEVQWSGKNTFSLVQSQGGQSLTIYSGKISGDEMALEAWNCDSVAYSCSLRRRYNEPK